MSSAGGGVLAAPFDVLPAGRMAVLTDPAGAPFCAWEAGDRNGAQLVNGCISSPKTGASPAQNPEVRGEIGGCRTIAELDMNFIPNRIIPDGFGCSYMTYMHQRPNPERWRRFGS